MPDDLKPYFAKDISLFFHKDLLNGNHDVIKKDIEDLLLKISTETDLIKQDNLARGEIVEAVSIYANAKDNEWSFRTGPLYDEVKENDPPEFWGDFNIFTPHPLSNMERYPWMPVPVSKVDFI